MRSSSLIICAALLSLNTLSHCWSPQFIDGIDHTYACSCVLRDELRERVPVTPMEEQEEVAMPIPPLSQQEISEFQPNRFWSMSNGHLMRSERTNVPNISFMERVLTMLRGSRTQAEAAPPTTVPPTTPPTVLPTVSRQSDATSEALSGLGKRIVMQYMNKLRHDWNLLDRFVCHCEGQLLDVLKARNYLTLKITHD